MYYIIALFNYLSLLTVDMPLKTSLKVRQRIVKNKETKKEGLVFRSITWGQVKRTRRQ